MVARQICPITESIKAYPESIKAYPINFRFFSHFRSVGKLTFIANKSPVALFRARNTRPNAPLLIGFIISKSSIDVRSLEHGSIGLARRLRTVSSSIELSSSTMAFGSTFSSSICPQRSTYFSL